MRETWLKPNRRAIWFGCVPPLLAMAIGAWMAFGTSSASQPLRWAGLVILAIGALVVILLLRQLKRPRIAFQDGQVHFYLRSGQPIEVPVDVVEAFFVGQGPAELPGGVASKQETMNLVARLSQRREEWARQDVKVSLGNWCGGYVTIRGTWCEPLEPELIRRLNRRLKEVKTDQPH